jgi:hypothetical protein
MHELDKWESFYLIVGPSAAVLIGLQFVVMTLIDGRSKQPGIEVANAFATPTTIHFGAPFLISALVRIPWKELTSVAVLWGLIGLIGIVYSAVVIKRMRSQGVYKPVFEDWLCHAWLPLLSYVILAVSAFFAASYEREALFAVGASSLLLLFVGIHNAWDTVTYNVFTLDSSRASKTELPSEADDISESE